MIKTTANQSIPLNNTKQNLIISYIIAASIFLFTLLYWILNSNIFFDDAYIHMRIARNFVEHGQPYFNRNEAVSGNSSPMWLWLISALFWLFGPSEQIINIISFLINLFFIATLSAVFRTRYTLSISLILSFLINSIFVINVSYSGMETALALSLWCCSIILLHKQKLYLAILIGALCVLVRYEYALWLIILSSIILLQYKTIKPISIALIPLSVLVIFQYSYYQTLIPNTIKAKSLIYQLDIYMALVHSFILQSLPIFIIIMILSLAIAIYHLRENNDILSLACILLGFTLLSLYLVRGTLIFIWYKPLYFVPIVVGHLLLLKYKHTTIRSIIIAIIFFFSYTSFTVAYTTISQVFLQQNSTDGWDLRTIALMRAAEDLAQQHPNAKVMAPEIGAIGWAYPGDIIDAVGLVSPELLQYHPLAVPEQRSNAGYGAIPVASVIDLQPDFIIAVDLFAEDFRRVLEQTEVLPYREQQIYLPSTDPTMQQNNPFTVRTYIRISNE
jgi:hypothetical protein